MTSALGESLLALIRRAAIHLPKDIEDAVEKAYREEANGSSGKAVLEVIRENIQLARELDEPLSHETSSIHFYVNIPRQFDPDDFEACAREAVAEATRLGYLQPGRADPVTEKVFRNNVGPGSPSLHFIPEEPDAALRVRIVLKGSGAENAGAQYSLPDDQIDAPRDLHGVHRAVLDSLIQAQGNGSGPGVLGVGIGGDRATGYALAHRQLLRPVSDRNRVLSLGRLEKRIFEDANRLGIGPMGFGGKSTVLGVRIGAESRPPGSCFVSISYIGWACRRQGFELSPKGKITRWLYEDYSDGKASTRGPAKSPAKSSAKSPAAKAAKTTSKTAKPEPETRTSKTTPKTAKAAKTKSAAKKQTTRKKSRSR